MSNLEILWHYPTKNEVVFDNSRGRTNLMSKWSEMKKADKHGQPTLSFIISAISNCQTNFNDRFEDHAHDLRLLLALSGSFLIYFVSNTNFIKKSCSKEILA